MKLTLTTGEVLEGTPTEIVQFQKLVHPSDEPAPQKNGKPKTQTKKKVEKPPAPKAPQTPIVAGVA